jgi:hypothetical protein
MPTKVTLTISDKALPELNKIVAETNLNQGTALTVAEWLQIHVDELAISRDLAVAVDQLRRQQETDAQASLDAAVRAARDQLLASLDAN